MAKMYKIFVAYACYDKNGIGGFSSCVLTSDIYPLTTSKITEMQNLIREENDLATVIILNFIKLAD